MKIAVHYFGQLRQIAGAAVENVDVAKEATVQQVVKDLAERYGEGFQKILLTENGGIRPSVMVLVNDAPVRKDAPHPLADGDRVKLLAAIAGG